LVPDFFGMTSRHDNAIAEDGGFHDANVVAWR
jgi:hypothetical protein